MLVDIKDVNDNLNKEQIEAIESINGYVFNSAPPGSGKTYVLENRILWMAVEHQIPTKNILAITFTNEAANEMRDRISKRLSDFNIENNVTALTFHSFAFKIIRNFGKGAISKYFTLIDENDKHKIISQMIKDSKIDEGNRALNTSLTKDYSNLISSYKSRGVTLKQAVEDIKSNQEKLIKYKNDKELMEKDGLTEIEILDAWELTKVQVENVKIYQKYEEYKAAYSDKGKLYDFDDLIINLKELLLQRDIRKKISTLYTYVLCDESQDIDEVQREILLLLSKDNGNLFCIFDDDQSIYSFRNADPNLILELPKLVTNPKEIVLKENFRSTKNIINAANYIINNNMYRIPKWMETNNPEGHLVTYKALTSKEKEAEFVCDEIERLRKEYNLEYRDFAILYRNNDLNKTMEHKLLKKNMPYKINRNVSFFQRKEVKDIIAYLEVIINKSPFHLERIYKVPARGFSEKTFTELKTQAQNSGVSIFEAISFSDKPKIKEFNNLLEEFWENSNKNFDYLVNLILEKTDYLKEEFKPDEIEKRLVTIKFLKSMLSELEKLFGTKEEALIQLKIYSSDDNEIDKENKISLMTIHSSKGKGFKCVFVIGCEDGILPSFNAVSDIQYEEERRLMYVAITRAKLFCYLTRSEYRLDYNGNLKKTKISPFIDEIPPELLDFDENSIF